MWFQNVVAVFVLTQIVGHYCQLPTSVINALKNNSFDVDSNDPTTENPVSTTFVNPTTSNPALYQQNNSNINITCEAHKDCRKFIYGKVINATCESFGTYSQCMCQGYRTIRLPCLPPKINGPCPCTIENTHCVDDKCVCRQSYMPFEPSNGESRCISAYIKLDENCESDAQCLSMAENTVCSPERKVCECQEHFVLHSSRQCLAAKDLGERCIDNQQCREREINAVCSYDREVCECVLNFVRSSKHQNKCIPVVGYNKKCIDTNQCQAILGVGSSCDSGVCVCNATHEAFKSDDAEHEICVRKVDYNDGCNDHVDCVQYGDSKPTMQCIFGVCVCRENFMYNENKRMCANSSKIISSPPIFISLVVPTILFFVKFFSGN